MAGLSDATRALLNKGQSLYKAGLGDALHDALLEATANAASDIALTTNEQHSETTSHAIARALAERLDGETLRPIIQSLQESAIPKNVISFLVASASSTNAHSAMISSLVAKVAKQDAAIRLIAAHVEAGTPANLGANVASILD